MKDSTKVKIILTLAALLAMAIPVWASIQFNTWYLLLGLLFLPTIIGMFYFFYKEECYKDDIEIKKCPRCNVEPIIELTRDSMYTNDLIVRCCCPKCGFGVTKSTSSFIGIPSYKLNEVIKQVKYKWNMEVKK